MTDPTLWSVGTLGKVHGLRGEMYLNLAPAGLERLEMGELFYIADRRSGGLRPCTVTRVGGIDRRPLVALDLARTREEAAGLQGCELLTAGARLEAQPHYRFDELLGVPVVTASGRPVGAVAEVLEAPAHEILVVRAQGGAEVLIPLVDELLVLEEGVLVVVDGLLGEPDVDAEG